MALPVIILRPEPGASATAARAQALGHHSIAAPLFSVAPIVWTPPAPDRFDALLLTSANSAREAGAALALYANLPCLCVGEATASAARAVGLDVAWVGDSDGGAALAEASRQNWQRLLWLCGKQHTPLVHPRISLTVVPVYEAAMLEPAPELEAALAHPAIVLLHSQRAAWALADLVKSRAHLGLIAISPGVAAVAGEGWAWVRWPDAPNDQAMLEYMHALCNNAKP